ncbi:MAG: GGDEF domain-containing protein [Lysobacter sp.]|nr:MAG: GGDEF domain-containing protein [Lysobacter sp.]
MRMLLLLLVCLGLLLPARAPALEPHKAFHHYVSDAWSLQQGLPQISVLSLTQDRRGYLWVGTQAGLARFDGVEFKVYTPETEPALPGTWIRALLTARDGRIWVGTYKGLAVQDGRRFMSVPAADPARWPALDVTGLLEDDDGTIFVTTVAGLFRVEGMQLQPVKGSPAPVQAPLLRPDGIWVGGRGQVYRRLQTGRWDALPLPAQAKDAQVNRLLTAQGAIWAATSAGLYRLGGTGWKPFDERAELAHVPVDMMFEDRDRNLWVGGDFGLARLRDGHVAEFLPVGSTGGIPGLRSAYEDREGNLWFGSQWEGLTRVWSSWTRRYSSAEGLGDRIVWSVARQPGDGLWIGGNDGVSLLENRRIRQVVPGSALPHPHAYNLLAERDRLWIGTRGGLRVLDIGTTVPHAVPELAAIGGAQVNAIVRAADGDLWIGTPEGLFRLRDGVLRRFGEDDGLADVRVRFVLAERDGRLLVGTQSGLFERRGERFVRDTGTGLPRGLDVTSILRMRDGLLVIGSLAERTYVGDGRRWQELGPVQGVPANTPFFLAEHSGWLWMAGIRGISRVPVTDVESLLRGQRMKARGEMLLNERGDRMSGQQGYCCNGAGTSKGVLEGTTLWLPTRDGVVELDARDIRKNPVAPGVVVEGLQVGDNWIGAARAAGHDLPGGARDVTFKFTVLTFQDPKSAQLQYRLNGYDQDWSEADVTNRRARYTNLPPGRYTFEVRASNNAGVWARSPAVLAFSVRPRFHETTWFFLLVAGGLLLLVYAGYRWQRRHFRIRQEALESIVAQRTQDLALVNRQLEEASHTDPLTGLRNRRYIGAQLPADLSFYDRQTAAQDDERKAMLFALVDIDHFKLVNDRYGHAAGDLVLQQFAVVLSGLVRTGDYVARWGGEEFLLVFRPMRQRNVSIIGERIQAAVSGHPFDLGNGLVLPLTCSVGLSQYPIVHDDDGAQLSWESMIELADQALYYVKANGRNGWASFRPTAKTHVDRLLTDLHAGVEAMLERGDLFVIGEIAGRRLGP